MDNILQKAIDSAQHAEIAFTKFITANDTGSTGGHQSGYHMHKNAWPLMFGEEGKKGQNLDKIVKIKWQDDFVTESRFIYYGSGTRNEYRLTRFGRGFPFLGEDNVGDLLIICKKSEEDYEAFVLLSDEEIEDFLAALNILSTETNQILPKQFQQYADDQLLSCFSTFISSLDVEFPTTFDLASTARNCFNKAYKIGFHHINSYPDGIILEWLDAEFQLFKSLEKTRYKNRIETPFSTVEELIDVANTILNRRKSRAGKSLEHHLSAIFCEFKLSFSIQQVTEGNKKPDFLFPNVDAYKDMSYDSNKLIMLASKTTCKDRWRQILNEADRIYPKHLFTLQQGISKNQLDEMYKHKVCLVIPSRYKIYFPKEYREKILTLKDFIKMIRELQK